MPKKIKLANWFVRIAAWLIDSIVILALAVILIGQPSQVPYAFSILGWFYWALTEWYWGQSAGKYAFKIKTTDLEAGYLTLPNSFLQAFGKAFLLPFDLVIGMLAFGETNQRLFSHMAQAVVIDTIQPHHKLDVKYTK